MAVVAIGITALVYGSVAILVKADDIGLKMSQVGRLAIIRALGRAIVKGMPGFMKLIAAIGTAAMLWVGGSIVIHGMEALGLGWPGHLIHDWAAALGRFTPTAKGAVEWTAKATMDGVFGLLLGMLLIPFTTRVLAPLWDAMVARVGGRGGKRTHSSH